MAALLSPFSRDTEDLARQELTWQGSLSSNQDPHSRDREARVFIIHMLVMGCTM